MSGQCDPDFKEKESVLKSVNRHLRKELKESLKEKHDLIKRMMYEESRCYDFEAMKRRAEGVNYKLKHDIKRLEENLFCFRFKIIETDRNREELYRVVERLREALSVSEITREILNSFSEIEDIEVRSKLRRKFSTFRFGLLSAFGEVSEVLQKIKRSESNHEQTNQT